MLARELVDAPSLAAVHAAAAPVKRRLAAAGVYSDVRLMGEAADATGDAINVVVGLRPKRTFGLAMGGTQSVSGRLEAGTEVSLYDVLGHAETVKLSLTSSPGSLSGSDILQTLSVSAEPVLGGGGGASGGGADAWAHTKRELLTVAPSYRLQLSKPTFGECAVCARRARRGRSGGARTACVWAGVSARAGSRQLHSHQYEPALAARMVLRRHKLPSLAALATHTRPPWPRPRSARPASLQRACLPLSASRSARSRTATPSPAGSSIM